MNVANTFSLEYDDQGHTFETSVFQLLQWKHALKLEILGLKLSGGRQVSTHLRKLMSLKRNTPKEYLLEWVTGALAAATGEGPEQ